MDKEIILHIGLHKTGTTSIQNMMYRNAGLLLKHGICYPTLHSNHSQFLSPLFDEKPKRKQLHINAGKTTPTQIAKLNLHYMHALEKELNNEKVSKIIFSGEELSVFNKDKLESFNKWLLTFSKNISIVCCTRNPIDWYSSRTQQLLRGGTRDLKSIYKVLCTDTKRSYKAIKTFVDFFGRQHITLYDFDKHKHHLYEKFLKSCSIKAEIIQEILKQPIQTKNESLSYEATLILNTLNQAKDLNLRGKFANKTISKLKRISGKKFHIPQEDMIKILEHNANSIEWLAKNFEVECGQYTNWRQQLNEKYQHEKFFEKTTVKSLALLIGDLINENKKLKTSPTYAFKKYIRETLIEHIKKTIPLRKMARSIREFFSNIKKIDN